MLMAYFQMSKPVHLVLASVGGHCFSLASLSAAVSTQDGQDFVAQSSLPSIDFAGFHLWPDNWVTYDASFPGTWITAHEQAAASIGKPLVLEEVSLHIFLLCIFVSFL